MTGLVCNEAFGAATLKAYIFRLIKKLTGNMHHLNSGHFLHALPFFL
jgi:hypothetical protein